MKTWIALCLPGSGIKSDTGCTITLKSSEPDRREWCLRAWLAIGCFLFPLVALLITPLAAAQKKPIGSPTNQRPNVVVANPSAIAKQGSKYAKLQPWLVKPVIASVSPTFGHDNTLVTIRGTGLQNVSSILFGNLKAGFKLNEDGTITAYAPPGGHAGSTVPVTGLGDSGNYVAT